MNAIQSTLSKNRIFAIVGLLCLALSSTLAAQEPSSSGGGLRAPAEAEEWVLGTLEQDLALSVNYPEVHSWLLAGLEDFLYLDFADVAPSGLYLGCVGSRSGFSSRCAEADEPSTEGLRVPTTDGRESSYPKWMRSRNDDQDLCENNLICAEWVHLNDYPPTRPMCCFTHAELQNAEAYHDCDDVFRPQP